MSSFNTNPSPPPGQNEVRVIERGGRRWLQQWRKKPGYRTDEDYEWEDVCELAPVPSTVRKLKPQS